MGRRRCGPGESDGTPEKEAFFGLCLGYHMARESLFLLGLNFQRPYFHIDLNAGAGYNPENRVVGTPVLFMRQAIKHPQVGIEACFIEKNPSVYGELRRNLATFGAAFNGSLFGPERNIRAIRGNNEEHLVRFVQEVIPRLDRPQYARGSIISDPNGWARSGGAVDLKTLKAAAQALTQFMILQFLHYSRAIAQRAEAERYHPTATTRRVRDFLPMRPYWLISEPKAGKVYLCGTAVRYPQGRRAYWLDSPRGREIMTQVDPDGEAQ